MAKYSVRLYWMGSNEFIVEAENEEMAKDIALDKDIDEQEIMQTLVRVEEAVDIVEMDE